MKTLRNIYIALVSLLLTLKRFHTFSQYFILQFQKVLPAGFISRDQSISDLINIFTKSTKAERRTDITFKLTLHYSFVTVEDQCYFRCKAGTQHKCMPNFFCPVFLKNYMHTFTFQNRLWQNLIFYCLYFLSQPVSLFQSFFIPAPSFNLFIHIKLNLYQHNF